MIKPATEEIRLAAMGNIEHDPDDYDFDEKYPVDYDGDLTSIYLTWTSQNQKEFLILLPK